MGSRCSALRRRKIKEKECHKPDQKKYEVSTAVKNGEKSPPLQRRPYLQKEGGAIKETTGEATLRRQEEDTAPEKLGCSEKRSALPHECIVVEVNTQR